jgi:hypothetical protein
VKADETGLGKLLPKTGPDSFFRYPAPKIVKCRISESSKKNYFATEYPPLFRQGIRKALQRKCLWNSANRLFIG